MSAPKKSPKSHAHSAPNAHEDKPMTDATHPTTAPAVAATLALPPGDARIPPVPDGFVAPSTLDYNGTKPRKSEIVAVAMAMADLQRFTEYAARLGPAAPPKDHVLKLLVAGSEWTKMRNQSAAWDAYCVTQEGIAWSAIKGLLSDLRTTFRLATKVDPALPTELPGLNALLQARKPSAQRAAATRRANGKAAAKGELPAHGQVGKRRKRSAERAALEKAQGQIEAPKPPPPPADEATPPAPPPPSPPAPAR